MRGTTARSVLIYPDSIVRSVCTTLHTTFDDTPSSAAAAAAASVHGSRPQLEQKFLVVFSLAYLYMTCGTRLSVSLRPSLDENCHEQVLIGVRRLFDFMVD